MYRASITCTYEHYTAVTGAIAEESWCYPPWNEDFHDLEIIVGHYDAIWEEQLPKLLSAVAANMPLIEKFEIQRY